MRGEVDFIAVRAGRLEERHVPRGRPGSKEMDRSWHVPHYIVSSRAPNATALDVVLHIWKIIIPFK